MHPWAARHGEGIPGGFLGVPRSVICDHMENRLPLQKALLARIILCQIQRTQTNDKTYCSHCG